MITKSSRVSCWTRRFAAAGLLLVHLSAFGGTVGYWRFEEGSGNVTADQTGIYDGDLIGFYDYSAGAGDTTGTGWSTNVFSATVSQTGDSNTGAIRMGGGGQYMDMSNGQDMLLGYEFTIELFMNPDQPVGSSPLFVLSGYSSLSLALTESLGELYWNMVFNSETLYTAATGVQIGTWQHVALVKVLGSYSIYINGELVASGSVSSEGDGPYYFPGTDNTGDRTMGNGFRGYLDELRISDTALTPDQFLCSAAIPEPGTLALLALGLVSLAFRRRK